MIDRRHMNEFFIHVRSIRFDRQKGKDREDHLDLSNRLLKILSGNRHSFWMPFNNKFPFSCTYAPLSHTKRLLLPFFRHSIPIFNCASTINSFVTPTLQPKQNPLHWRRGGMVLILLSKQSFLLIAQTTTTPYTHCHTSLRPVHKNSVI